MEYDDYELNGKEISVNNIEFIADKSNYNQYSDKYYLHFGNDNKNVSNDDRQLAMLAFARLERTALVNMSSETIEKLKNIINNVDPMHMVPESWVYHKKGVYTYVKSIKASELKKYFEQITN